MPSFFIFQNEFNVLALSVSDFDGMIFYTMLAIVLFIKLVILVAYYASHFDGTKIV